MLIYKTTQISAVKQDFTYENQTNILVESTSTIPFTLCTHREEIRGIDNDLTYQVTDELSGYNLYIHIDVNGGTPDYSIEPKSTFSSSTLSKHHAYGSPGELYAFYSDFVWSEFDVFDVTPTSFETAKLYVVT